MKEPRLIIGIGELLWDILPGHHLGGLPYAETKTGAGGQPVPAVAAVGAVSPEEALPIGLPGTFPVETIPPTGLPAPPKADGAICTALLGGAPANFAVMAGRLGNHAAILSCIGRDQLGRMAMDQLDPMPVDTSAIEVNPEYATGRVTVEFLNHEPRYTIHQPAAWDFLRLTDEWIKLAEQADAICFGSLAQRNAVARQTIQAIAAETRQSCIRIFDVNLRPPFVSGKILQESLELASVVKMNHEELPRVLQLLGMPAGEETGELQPGAERILAEFPSVKLIAITRGSHGSLLVDRDEWDDHPGIPVKLADTIGAGDAFTAALVHYMLRGAPLSKLNEAGNRWGGWVASQSGAMPALPAQVRDAIAAVIEQ